MARTGIIVLCYLCLASSVQSADDDDRTTDLDRFYKKKEQAYNAKERVMHAKNNAYADKWRLMMQKAKDRENKDVPFKVSGRTHLLMQEHPKGQCTELDIFNFCVSDMRESLSNWYARDRADGHFERIPNVDYSHACYPWLTHEEATTCMTNSHEAAFWLDEAVSRDERFGKLTELVYQCYRCMRVSFPQMKLKPSLDVACATPDHGAVDRCEHRCAEKLAEKYKVPVLTKVCWRSESDFQGFGAHNYRIHACKEFKEEKKMLSKKQKENDMSYEMEMDVCSCMSTCERKEVTCTPNKYSLADLNIANENAGICCATAGELAQHVGVAMIPEHDELYGGHIFDYNSYTQTKVCSWDGQLDSEICKKRKQESKTQAERQNCGKRTSRSPTLVPTERPTRFPTNRPTGIQPTPVPTKKPTLEPTMLSGKAYQLFSFLNRHSKRYTIPTPAPTPCKKFDDDYDDGGDDKASGCMNET